MKKKENIVIIIVLVVMILAIIGVSYAAFNYSGLGTKVNTITSGVITMSYTETDNTISLNGALPTTDATGKVRLNPGEYFDFTVSGTIKGDTNINYEIAAEDVTDSSARKIDGKYIKLYLTEIEEDGSEVAVSGPSVYQEDAMSDNYTGRPGGMMSLATNTTSESFETNYRLRMYVSEEYNPQGDGGNLQFSVKINVYGKNGEAMPTTRNVMRASISQEDFHTLDYMDKTTSIVTKLDVNIPETAIESWDISLGNDGTVVAYSEDDGAGGYKITIGGRGKLLANPDMNSYFGGFSNAKTIDLTYLDTNQTTDMSGMFNNCVYLESLIFGSKFNTQNVTYMFNMFGASKNLVELDLSMFGTINCQSFTQLFIGDFTSLKKLNLSNLNFPNYSVSYGSFDSYAPNLEELDLSNTNFPNLTSMDLMFGGLNNLKKLDLTNFNTPNITSMYGMFSECSSLIELDLSSVDTSNVTNMMGMFQNCTNLTKLDLSSFNTSNVTDMSLMFFGCNSLKSIDLSSFNTSNVTNMGSMFNDCSSLTELDLSNFVTTEETNLYQMLYFTTSLTRVLVSKDNFIVDADDGNMFYGSGVKEFTYV